MPATRKHAREPYKGRHRRPSAAVRATAAASGAACAAAIAGTALGSPAAHASTAQPYMLPAGTGIVAGAVEQATVTVEPGDSLYSIAGHVCGRGADWTGLYDANRGLIADPDDISPGWKLRIDCKAATVPAAVSAPAPAGQQLQPEAQQPEDVSLSSYSGFQACVIDRESGGNAQVTNSSGHYGLYQFSASTWEEYGGSAADFGDATVAEQNQVFDNAMATPGGAGNWSTYDGCTP